MYAIVYFERREFARVCRTRFESSRLARSNSARRDLLSPRPPRLMK